MGRCAGHEVSLPVGDCVGSLIVLIACSHKAGALCLQAVETHNTKYHVLMCGLCVLHRGVQVVSALFLGLVPDALHLVRKQLRETVPTCNHNLVTSCFNLMDALLRPYLQQEGESSCAILL